MSTRPDQQVIIGLGTFAGVDGQQQLVGGGDGLGANEFWLTHDSRLGQRRAAGLRDLGQADVARLGEQRRADTRVEILGAGAALAEMCERIGKLVTGPWRRLVLN